MPALTNQHAPVWQCNFGRGCGCNKRRSRIKKGTIHKAAVDTKLRLEWRIKDGNTSVIGQWWKSPVSEQIWLSFSSWRGNFVPVIAPPSSPKLLLISAFQFPPLCKRQVLTYFRLSLRWVRAAGKRRVREQRRGTVVGSHFSLASGFPRGVGTQIQSEKSMLWLGSTSHALHRVVLANDCKSILCLL